MRSSAGVSRTARNTARIGGTSTIDVSSTTSRSQPSGTSSSSRKAAGPQIGPEQAMDRLRLEPHARGEAFGGTAGRRTKRDLHGLREQDLKNGVDGNPVRFLLTTGQAHDLTGADALLPQMAAEVLISDKAYDADDRVVKPLASAGKSAVIPPRQNRTAPASSMRRSTRHAT
jgi:hypothetical protein